jgi:hypothetical protein
MGSVGGIRRGSSSSFAFSGSLTLTGTAKVKTDGLRAEGGDSNRASARYG